MRKEVPELAAGRCHTKPLCHLRARPCVARSVASNRAVDSKSRKCSSEDQGHELENLRSTYVRTTPGTMVSGEGTSTILLTQFETLEASSSENQKSALEAEIALLGHSHIGIKPQASKCGFWHKALLSTALCWLDRGLSSLARTGLPSCDGAPPRNPPNDEALTSPHPETSSQLQPRISSDQ